MPLSMTKSFDRQQEEIDDILSNNKDDYFVWYMGTSPLSLTEHIIGGNYSDYMSYYIEELSDEEHNQYFGDVETAEIIIDGIDDYEWIWEKVMNEIKNK